jgi:hypothetical protein
MDFDLKLTRARFGLWSYLARRAYGRIQVQLEHARNQGTAQAILLLSPGGELWEIEPGGRTRIIRRPGERQIRTAGEQRTVVRELPR